MSTHKFTLPSGFECEVREMVGKHQRILTEKKGDYNDKLNEILVDVLVRVGDVTSIDFKFVEGMLSADRKAALVTARNFTLDFPETFPFKYTFKGAFTLRDGDVVTEHRECTEDLEVPTPEFPIRPYAGREEWAGKPYSAINKVKKLKLPKSGQEVQYTLLDGAGEKRSMQYKEVSSHTPLQIRGVSYMHKGDNEEVPISLNLEKVSLKDIEAIRKHIDEHEGGIDTIVVLEHPHKDKVDDEFRTVRVDLLSEVAFFFPSQAL